MVLLSILYRQTEQRNEQQLDMDSAYLATLSPASVQSLALQGGPMSADEVRAFAASPHFAAAIQLRRFDDLGKVPDMLTPPLEHFRP